MKRQKFTGVSAIARAREVAFYGRVLKESLKEKDRVAKRLIAARRPRRATIFILKSPAQAVITIIGTQ